MQVVHEEECIGPALTDAIPRLKLCDIGSSELIQRFIFTRDHSEIKILVPSRRRIPKKFIKSPPIDTIRMRNRRR